MIKDRGLIGTIGSDDEVEAEDSSSESDDEVLYDFSYCLRF